MENMKTLIVGFSISGKASAELLRSQGKEVIAVDRKRMDGALAEDAELPWEEIEQVVVSPGVSLKHRHVEEARLRGIEVIGEVELACRHLKNRMIGMTGTNGKTTAALLTTHILKKAGLKARALGNIGESLSSYAIRRDDEEILVVELSSFQLETMERRCLDVAICLNITPDHLDRYDSMADYAKAKCRIENCLKEGGEMFVSSQIANEYGSLLKKPIPFDEIPSPVALISSMRYIQLGLPEFPNIQAVYPLCRHFGVSDTAFMRGLETFRKPRHRIEYLGEQGGIAFYNDSKATNIDAVMYAVSLMDGPIALLAGGVDKGASYRPWIQAFGSKVVRIVAFGEAAPKLEAELSDAFSFVRKETMEEALTAAVRMAEAPMNIVLSPGCSSYDAFRNYEHRGDEFKRMVEEKVWIEEKRS